jgi:elongation factor G
MAAKPAVAPVAIDRFRNIGVIAHIDAGKTTTTEHLLFYSGAKHRLGGVDQGTTETDYDPEEQARGITIYSACIPFRWRDCTVNLIDTPGHVDFTAEVERSLRVLDGAVVVFDAQKGVEAQSETVWRQADKYRVPRLVFVNKMDVVGANFDNTVAEVRERLEGSPVALNFPIGSGSVKDSATPFKGVVDLLEMKALYFDPKDDGKTFRSEPIPEDLQLDALSYREKLFDALTAHDPQDLITSAYLEGKEVPLDVLRRLIREQTLARQIQPVLCGSGREHIGVQPLLDAVTYYLPSPLDRPPVEGTNPKKKNAPEKRRPDPKEPFCALVFKIVAGESSELYYLRVYSGTLRQGKDRPYNPGKDAKELLSKIYHTMADPRDREEVAEAPAGDIVAVLGLRDSVTGDTLCDAAHPILLEPIKFADAVVSQVIEPESSADKDKVEKVLNLLRKEDPTFNWKVDRDTAQTVMSGMGTLHLEIKRHRMERDFKLKVRVSKPRVSYRETIRHAVTVEGECIRQFGGANLFAKVTVRFEPWHGDRPVLVESKLKHDTLPPELVHAAEQGLRNGLESGQLGFPVLNVKATLLDAQMDVAQSNETAFLQAGADAVNRALRDNVVLLEPVMKLEVTVPEEFFGSILGDLMARRADFKEPSVRGKLRVIDAVVPLRTMFDYADKARSLTQGRASYTLEPKAYAPAPDDVLEKMLNPDAL